MVSNSGSFLFIMSIVRAGNPEAHEFFLQATIAGIASISDEQTVKNFFVAIMKKLLQATVEAATPATQSEAAAMEVDAPKPEESATSRRCYSGLQLSCHCWFWTG